MRYRRESDLETLFKVLVSFVAVPVVITVMATLVAGCYTVIWHIGNWVGWW